MSIGIGYLISNDFGFSCLTVLLRIKIKKLSRIRGNVSLETALFALRLLFSLLFSSSLSIYLLIFWFLLPIRYFRFAWNLYILYLVKFYPSPVHINCFLKATLCHLWIIHGEYYSHYFLVLAWYYNILFQIYRLVNSTYLLYISTVIKKLYHSLYE